MQISEKKNCIITTKVTRVKTHEGKLMNQYLKLKRIGDGPHSKVVLYKNIQNNKFYAVKKFSLYLLKKKTRLSKDLEGKNKHISIVDDIRREVQIMKKLNHPNVVTLYEVIDDLQNEKLYLVMDYCEKGQIASWNHKKHEFDVKKEYLQPIKFRNLLKQIYKGLNYCKQSYKKGIHRDIKPQNILITENQTVKIIDFGRAIQLKSSNQKLKGSQGTYHFMAPESLSELDKDGYDGKKADIWSLGVSIFCICTKKLPFDAEPILRLFQKIEKVNYEFPKGVVLQDWLKKSMCCMLIGNPLQRMELDELNKLAE